MFTDDYKVSWYVCGTDGFVSTTTTTPPVVVVVVSRNKSMLVGTDLVMMVDTDGG